MKLLIIFLALTTTMHAINLNTVLYLSTNMQNGKELILTDNSKWDIAPEDQITSQLWIGSFPLKITLGGSKEYPYLLTSIHSQKKVKARPSL